MAFSAKAAWYCPAHGRQDAYGERMPPYCLTPVGDHRCGATLFHSTEGKHYPTDPRGFEDHVDFVPAKPCARRITHERAADPALHTAITWCTLPSDHDGQCSGPPPRVIPTDDLGPGYTKRRRAP